MSTSSPPNGEGPVFLLKTISVDFGIIKPDQLLGVMQENICYIKVMWVTCVLP